MVIASIVRIEELQAYAEKINSKDQRRNFTFNDFHCSEDMREEIKNWTIEKQPLVEMFDFLQESIGMTLKEEEKRVIRKMREVGIRSSQIDERPGQLGMEGSA
jgi:hypothetical protein